MACIAQADPSSSSYSVQIGTYKSLPKNFVGSAEKYGRVYTSQSGDLTRVSVGGFDNRNAAQNLLSQLKQAGYEDAFISHTGSSMSSNQPHDKAHHQASPGSGSEMAKFRNLPESEKERAVFVDGKLHLKEGSSFIPVP
mgnify:FL=1|tara:strand:- start:414 stop:830 length:417 start_codon:yes stop_codon:yes gene_type:complete